MEESQNSAVVVQPPDLHLSAPCEVKNYVLNPDKALDKKLSNCDRKEEIKITSTFGGTKLIFQTGAYELFKTAARNYFKTIPDQPLARSVRDQKGAEVSQVYRITSKDGKKYTLNLYHTTSSALVNGRNETLFLNTDLPNIIKSIDGKGNGKHLNQLIKQSLLKLENHAEEPDDQCPICHEQVEKQAVLCFKGNHWVHYSCENLSKKAISRLSQEPLFKCTECSGATTQDNTHMLTPAQHTVVQWTVPAKEALLSGSPTTQHNSQQKL